MTKDQNIQQYAQQNVREHGAPHGVMTPDELTQIALQRWEGIKSQVPLEQRSEFEPVFEALIARVVTSTGNTQSAFLTASGSSR